MMVILVIVLIVLIVIGSIQAVIFGIMLTQAIIRRHVHVLEKRHLAMIWRVRDRDGEDLSNQVVHVQWYNIVVPEIERRRRLLEERSAPVVDDAVAADSQVSQPGAVPVAGVAVQQVHVPQPEVHLQMGPAPPAGYDTLVCRVKGLTW